jgi:hypothetical protein
MKKELKIIEKLTNKVEGSLPFLKNGIKRLVVLIETDKVGLIAVLGSKISSDPLDLGLNFTSFKAGLAETFTKIISAPAVSFIGAKS